MARTLVKLVTNERLMIDRDKDDIALELARQALAPFVTTDNRRVTIAASAVAFLQELE